VCVSVVLSCPVLIADRVSSFVFVVPQLHRLDDQYNRFEAWQKAVISAKQKVVVIEIGAGEAVPTVRHTSEWAARRPGCTLIRYCVCFLFDACHPKT
jgi:hypothetical protein